MSITEFEKNQIRSRLLLELNSCFTKVSKEYRTDGNEEQRIFLQDLIESIRNCFTCADGSEFDVELPELVG